MRRVRQTVSSRHRYRKRRAWPESAGAHARRRVHRPAITDDRGSAALTLVETNLPGSNLIQGFGEAQRNATDVVRDRVGRITSFTDASSSSRTTGVFGTIVKITRGSSRSPPAPPAHRPAAATGLQYDAVSNLVRVVESNGDVDDFSYNEEDALVEVHSTSGFAGQLSYDPQGNLGRVALVEGDGTVARRS